MNVKSFVNGLDPDNTVKGYYDENDQLVMVEPEGSGGGGGPVSSFNVAVVNNSESAFVMHAYFADIEAEIISMPDEGESVAPGASATLLVVSLGGGAVIGVENTNITIEGPHEETAGREYKITGDVTITVAGA